LRALILSRWVRIGHADVLASVDRVDMNLFFWARGCAASPGGKYFTHHLGSRSPITKQLDVGVRLDELGRGRVGVDGPAGG
jgi:hypothetical protein